MQHSQVQPTSDVGMWVNEVFASCIMTIKYRQKYFPDSQQEKNLFDWGCSCSHQFIQITTWRTEMLFAELVVG